MELDNFGSPLGAAGGRRGSEDREPRGSRRRGGNQERTGKGNGKRSSEGRSWKKPKPREGEGKH